MSTRDQARVPQPPSKGTLYYLKPDGLFYKLSPEGEETLILSHPPIEVDIIDEETILLRSHPSAKAQGVYKRVR